MMKQKPVQSLTNKELLEEYRFLVGWAADDYCLTDMKESDHKRMYRAEEEILKRMNVEKKQG